MRHALTSAIPLLLAVCSAGCNYLGSARDFDPEELDRSPGWIVVRGVPMILQETEEDCGAAALDMVLRYWNRPAGRREILESCPVKPEQGIKARDLRDFARERGLRAYLLHGDWHDFEVELGRGHPVIVGMIKPHASGNVSHYEVVVAIRADTKEVVTLDPAHGWRRNSGDGFFKEWDPAGRLAIVVFAESPAASPPDGR